MPIHARFSRLRRRLPGWNRLKLTWSVLHAGAPIWTQIERAGLWPYVAAAVLLSVCTRILSINDLESSN